MLELTQELEHVAHPQDASYRSHREQTADSVHVVLEYELQDQHHREPGYGEQHVDRELAFQIIHSHFPPVEFHSKGVAVVKSGVKVDNYVQHGDDVHGIQHVDAVLFGPLVRTLLECQKKRFQQYQIVYGDGDYKIPQDPERENNNNK